MLREKSLEKDTEGAIYKLKNKKKIRQVIKNMDEIKEFINKMANNHNLSYEEAEKLAITREYINYVSNNHCYYCEKGGGT